MATATKSGSASGSTARRRGPASKSASKPGGKAPSGPARKPRPGKASAGSVKESARKATKPARKASKAVSKAPSKPARRLALLAARKGAKALARRAVRAGAGALRGVVERGAEVSHDALDGATSRRPPIQASVDVAVPAIVAWDEWRHGERLVEGVHRIEDVERDGDRLFGRTAGPHSVDWEAEIVDEREAESFAWRSLRGTDCAGLVTFHELSERLTRIELDLDVLPRTPGELLMVTSGLGRRRAEADLRRFKAHVEFINPDVYASRADGNEEASEDAEAN